MNEVHRLTIDGIISKVGNLAYIDPELKPKPVVEITSLLRRDTICMPTASLPVSAEWFQARIGQPVRIEITLIGGKS